MSQMMKRTILIAALAALLLPATNRGNFAWLRVGQTRFAGGFGQSLASDGQDLYVLRQFAANTRSDFQRLVLTAGLVTRTMNLSAPPFDVKDGTAMVFDPDGNLYAMFGASYGEQRRAFARYTGGRWLELSPTPADQGAGDAMVFASHQAQRYLYAMAGAATVQRPGAVTAFMRYQLSNNRWEHLPDPPWECSDDGSALAWDGGEFIYAFQGSDCQDQPTTTFARYYLTLELWERLPPAPASVDYGGSLAWNGGQFVYAITGAQEPFEGRGYFRFDLDGQAWDLSLPPLNCSVGDYNGNRLAVVDGLIFYWQGTPPTWSDVPECDGTGLYVSSSR